MAAPAHPDNGAASPPEIQVEHLTKRYRGVVALEDISFSVERGELFGIVGADGSGKTTLMGVLAGLIPPDEGQVTVAGLDVARRPKALATSIGYAAGALSLYRDLTLGQNFHFFADLYRLPLREYRERAQRLLELTGLAPFQGRLVRNLSGGMRQKAALAATLLHQPSVLLLDEPSSGVDPISRRDIWNILYSLIAQGATLLVATSTFEDAERCSRIAFLHSGRLLRVAPPGEFRTGMAGEVWEISELPARRAREDLVSLPGLDRVNLLGGRLRVVCRDAQCAERVAEWFSSSEYSSASLRQVAPTLEEALASLITRGAAAQSDG
jgi:ABC-2 type transport system ATP-binding protein